MNELFNSPFELSLRVLIILNTAQLRLTIDKIVAYDFISTYSSDFGISESNLHGNNSYRFSEYTTKRIIITQSIKNLVLEGFVLPHCNKGGFSYSISPVGKNFCSSLNDDYANGFTQIVQQTFLKKLVEQKTSDIIDTESLGESENKFKVKDYFDYSFVSEFGKWIKLFLEDCKYPNLTSLIFDKATMDIVLNGKKKSANGKGYNAYLNSAVAIVLSRYMQKHAHYAPGLILLDSPILSLKEIDTQKPSQSMRNGLFENIASTSEGIQTIVIENEIPEIDYSNVNLIHFTKNANTGRYGFLIDVMD